MANVETHVHNHSHHRSPDTRDLFVQEFEVILSKSGEATTIQYFCNRDNEPVYFPDRTLSALFQVNLSTLRGRFNRMTKKHEGYRLLISEKSKTRLSSLHFINWGSEHFLDSDCTSVYRSASPLHGLVALNHIVLVNHALAEWIAYNHERLGTSLADIENNLKKVHLPYTRTNNVITIQQKRPLTVLHNPSSMYRHANHRERLLDHKILGPPQNSHLDCKLEESESSGCRACALEYLSSSAPSSPSPSPSSSAYQSIGVKRHYDESCDYEDNTNNTTTTTTTTTPRTNSYASWEALSGLASRKLPRLRSSCSSPPPLTSSAAPSPPDSPPSTPYLVDNTIQCVVEGETACHRIDLSCLDGFGSLRSALSSLFRLNSFNIFYQSVLDPLIVELKEIEDYETYQQFRTIVKKIIVRPYSVTPALKNLLW